MSRLCPGSSPQCLRLCLRISLSTNNNTNKQKNNPKGSVAYYASVFLLKQKRFYDQV